MSRPAQTKCWIVSKRPHGTPTISGPDPTFTLTTLPLPDTLGPDQALVKVLHLSNDPAQRSWINPTYPQERFYTKQVAEGDVMKSLGVGEVVESTSSEFKPGDRISGMMGWAEYAVLGSEDFRVPVKPLPNGLDETHYLGAFGLTGLTAYFGLVKIAEIKEGEGVLVSGAAGATGSMVVQLAKRVFGCKYVVGIAGTEEKCRWVESLGADRCVNYKSPSFVQDLQDVTRGRIDVYFDNVGGAVLDEALGILNIHGRVVACGFIAGYNGDNGPPLRNWWNVVCMKLRIEGFVVLKYYNEADKAIEVIGKALAEGKVQLEEKSETIIKGGLEDVPKVWMRLFEGANTGKLVTTLQ